MDRPTLSAQVARHLLALVSREHLRPGDQVPSEVQIGQQLRISRGSVREAYRTLSALGILEIEGGRKPRLRAFDPAALSQVFGYAVNTTQVTPGQVLETRRALELHTTQLAASQASDAQRLLLRELIGRMRTAGEDRTSRTASEREIHTTIAQASGNPLFAVLLSALRASLEASPRVRAEQQLLPQECTVDIDAHAAIVECICAGDAAGAVAAMSHHFDIALTRVDPTRAILSDRS
ncbi:MAG: FadR family transcriptional regulator [Proteobacteria bacterium]|nr:FadR family transcriptional regulator [Pseudomonadota bacterium]